MFFISRPCIPFIHSFNHCCRKKNPEDYLYALPENIQKIVAQKKRSEDMLSNQMLSGIPEVDLGIE